MPGDHRRAAGHGLDHHQAERFRPVDREQQRLGVAEKCRFLAVTDLAHELDQGMVQQRLDDLVEVCRIHGVNLGGDLQRQARALGDRDGTVRAFLGRDPAKEGEVGGLPGAGLKV